jgi:hypothetical protein
MIKTLLATLAATAALSGCAAMPTDGSPLAANASPPLDCKVVVIDSTAQSMRLANGRAANIDDMNRVEGAQEATRLYAQPPRQLRAPPGNGLVNDAFYGC